MRHQRPHSSQTCQDPWLWGLLGTKAGTFLPVLFPKATS
jgi:hypothetical protein